MWSYGVRFADGLLFAETKAVCFQPGQLRAEPNFIVPKALLHSTLQTPHSKLIFHPIAFSVLREMPFTSMWKKMLHQMELVRS